MNWLSELCPLRVRGHFVAFLAGLALILSSCRPGGVTPTVLATASPDFLPATQAETASALASPTPLATASAEIAPLSSPPYPEPREGPVVTKAPPARPDATPTGGSADPTVELTAISTEAVTPLPPPYPGAGTLEPTNPNLPPYPITTGTTQPTATPPGNGPTPTSAGSIPTATGQPETAPSPTPTPQLPATPTLTPTVTPTPTIPPTPRPRVEPREIDISCVLDGTTLLCEDEIIDYSFALPSEWIMGMQGILRPGETGVQYEYDLQRAINARPEKLRIGGLSWDFTPAQAGFLTDFAGFESDSTADRCAQFPGAKICEPLREEILIAFLFPEAERLCHDGHPLVNRPQALIALDLPDNELINGFVFVGDFLSPTLLESYEADRADLQESATLAGEPCDAFRQSRFNVRMLVLVAGVRNEILDQITLNYLAQWRQLGESLSPLIE